MNEKITSILNTAYISPRFQYNCLFELTEFINIEITRFSFIFYIFIAIYKYINIYI